jgi:hypothetical protein
MRLQSLIAGETDGSRHARPVSRRDDGLLRLRHDEPRLGQRPGPPASSRTTRARAPDGLVILDTWESQQDFENFAHDRLFAAIGAAAGGEAPQVEPTFVQIHREEHA